MRIFVPRDSVSVALGSDKLAAAIAAQAAERGVDVSIIRNGSRGLFWLEPLVEIETAR
jgi:formate dehydrogenase iron-sulfur subunit